MSGHAKAIAAVLSVVIVVELIVLGSRFASTDGKQESDVVSFWNDELNADRIAVENIRLLAAKARSADDWAKLADLLLAHGYFLEAEYATRQVIAEKPDDSASLFVHGFALERLGLIEEANRHYQKALDAGSKRRQDILFYIARNHLRLGSVEEAMAAFGQAGDLPAARFERARLLLRQGQLDEAELLLADLDRQFPDCNPVWALKYRLAVARGNADEAETAAYRYAHTTKRLPNPFDREVDWLLGTEEKTGRVGRFKEGFEAIVEGRTRQGEAAIQEALDAEWIPELADRWAEAQFGMGRREEALATLENAVERAGPEFTLLWRLGQAQDALGEASKALESWERAVENATGPAAQGLWYDLAERYKKLGNDDEARRLLARSLVAKGSDALKAGQAARAVETLKQAVATEPHLAHAWYVLGESQLAADDLNAAIRLYEKCLNQFHNRVLTQPPL